MHFAGKDRFAASRSITISAEVDATLESLQKVGIDLDTIAEQWQAESVAAVARALSNVLTTLDFRRSAGPDHERRRQPCLP